MLHIRERLSAQLTDAERDAPETMFSLVDLIDRVGKLKAELTAAHPKRLANSAARTRRAPSHDEVAFSLLDTAKPLAEARLRSRARGKPQKEFRQACLAGVAVYLGFDVNMVKIGEVARLVNHEGTERSIT